MKRFYIALTLMTVILISAIFFNMQIKDKTLELMEISEKNLNAENIHNWWIENKIWFELSVPEELKKDMETCILLYTNSPEDKINLAQIKSTAEKVLNSTQFSVENIF